MIKNHKIKNKTSLFWVKVCRGKHLHAALVLVTLFASCSFDQKDKDKAETKTKQNVPAKTKTLITFENKKVLFVYYFDNGQISSINLELDSLALPENIEITQKIYTYHRNGKLKTVSFQGLYNSCGVPVLNKKVFDRDGKKTQEIIYHNDVFGKDYIIFHYFKNDSIYLTKKTNNYILYETEEKEFGK